MSLVWYEGKGGGGREGGRANLMYMYSLRDPIFTILPKHDDNIIMCMLAWCMNHSQFKNDYKVAYCNRVCFVVMIFGSNLYGMLTWVACTMWGMHTKVYEAINVVTRQIM
jgi:hypothetical protein